MFALFTRADYVLVVTLVGEVVYCVWSYGEYSITSVLKLTDIIVYFSRLTYVILIRSYDVKLSLSHQQAMRIRKSNSEKGTNVPRRATSLHLPTILVASNCSGTFEVPTLREDYYFEKSSLFPDLLYLCIGILLQICLYRIYENSVTRASNVVCWLAYYVAFLLEIILVIIISTAKRRITI